MATMESIQKAAAEMQATQKAFEAQLGTKSTTSAVNGSAWNQELVTNLSIGVLVFAGVVLIAASVLLCRQRATAGEVMRFFGIVLIITFSTLLVIVGYSNEQLTPIIGLFGAIAGYLLGKEAGRGVVPKQ
jgi:hypothetical protein